MRLAGFPGGGCLNLQYGDLQLKSIRSFDTGGTLSDFDIQRRRAWSQAAFGRNKDSPVDAPAAFVMLARSAFEAVAKPDGH